MTIDNDIRRKLESLPKEVRDDLRAFLKMSERPAPLPGGTLGAIAATIEAQRTIRAQRPSARAQ